MDTKAIFKEWERLRLVYNIILFAVFAVLVVDAYFSSELGAPQEPFSLILFHSAIYALIANILYLAGPAVDSYMCWLDIRSKYSKVILFVAGTAFSIILEIGVLALELSPF